MDTVRSNTATILLAAVLVAAAPALSQDYPSRPIRVIVPFSPGGGSDILARFLGPGLSARLGQPVVVDNRPSGSGILGTDMAAKSSPDGHTLLLAQSAHAHPDYNCRLGYKGNGILC